MGCISWSEIPEDILSTISSHLPTVIDYLNVSQVCKPWRSTLLSPLNLTIPTKPPFLMLAATESNEKTSKSMREFVEFNNNQGNHHNHKVFTLPLPEIHHDTRIMGSTGNWLSLINLELDICMFNPFTKRKLDFPSQTTLPYQFKVFDCDSDCESDCEGHGYTQEELRNDFIEKAFLFFLSTSNVSDVVTIVIFSVDRRLAIARPGDMLWTPVQCRYCSVTDVIVSEDWFYSVNPVGNVAAYDISSTPPRAIQIGGDFKVKNSDLKIYSGKDGTTNSNSYLVEWLGKLLMVKRDLIRYRQEPFYKSHDFRVYMFDFDSKEWEEVTSLGEHSLFLGFNTSVSLLVSECSPFKKNCIYFTDSKTLQYLVPKNVESGHDMGVFDLNDKTIKPHFNEVSTSSHSPPLWIIPQSIC